MGRAKKRGLPAQLPGLTPPSRAFGLLPSNDVDEDGEETQPDPFDDEYSGAYTVRTAKVRPGQTWYAWVTDSIFGAYEAPVLIMGIRPNDASDQASPYEILCDVVTLTNCSQLGPGKHDVLLPEKKIAHMMPPEEANPDVWYLINWVITVPLSCVRDPFHCELLPSGAKVKKNTKYLAGFLALQTIKTDTKKKVRRVSYAAGTTRCDLAALMKELGGAGGLGDMLPSVDYYIRTPSTIHCSDDPKIISAIPRCSLGFIETGITFGPGRALQTGADERDSLFFGVRTRADADEPPSILLMMPDEKQGIVMLPPSSLVLQHSRVVARRAKSAIQAELAIEDPFDRMYFAGSRDLVLTHLRESITSARLKSSVNVIIADNHYVPPARIRARANLSRSHPARSNPFARSLAVPTPPDRIRSD